MTSEWLVLYFVLISVFWLFLRHFYTSEFAMWIASTFSGKALSNFLYELNGRLSFFIVATEILSFVSLSFFLLKVSKYFHLQFFLGNSFELMAYFIAFSFVLIFFKSLLLYFIRYFFNYKDIIGNHFIILHIYNGLTGLIILPFLFILYFAPDSFTTFFLIMVLCIVIIVFLLKNLAIFTNLLRSSFSFFGILLYLCSLEIIPILVLFKAILFLTK